MLSSNTLASTIVGFDSGDTIDIAKVSDVSVGYQVNDGSLVATFGSGDAQLTFDDPTLQDMLVVTPDGSGGAFVEVGTAVCFCRGTLIRTPDGDVPVEFLRVGDWVRTWSGRPRPIRWIGTGRMPVTQGHRGPAAPVIVRRGALGDDIPDRDLHVTKGHSLFIDDVLIPVEFLVNHRSIVWDDRAQEVVFFHVELDAHDILIANGAPAESYRDDGNRWMFQVDNSVCHACDLPPRAPVLTGGPMVDAIWRRLLDRCGPGPDIALTEDPDLHLLADGQRVDAALRGDGWHVFDLAAQPRELRLVSRAAAPAELGLARDPRRLGVAVRQIQAWSGQQIRLIEASDTALVDGFHGYEPEQKIRWTSHDARLPEALLAGFPGGCRLEVRLAGSMQYPLAAVVAGAPQGQGQPGPIVN